nr:immunoglobulin heavy chain junction region [Homo sapiens]
STAYMELSNLRS